MSWVTVPRKLTDGLVAEQMRLSLVGLVALCTLKHFSRFKRKNRASMTKPIDYEFDTMTDEP